MIMESEQHTRLHHTQKVGFALLVVFAMMVLVLGVYQFRTTIYGPFAHRPVERDQKLAAVEQLFDDEAARLQLIDTDQDGINDYEELNFYSTSPYIADTDSDGIDDKTEIEQGTDPICPIGGDCELYNPNDVIDTGAGTLENPLLDAAIEGTDPLVDLASEFAALGDSINTLSAETGTTTGTLSDLSPEAQFSLELLLSNPDAIRDLLRQNSNLTDAEIDAFDDEYLLQVATEILSES